MSVGSSVTDYSSALDFLLHRINYERTTSIPYQSSEFKLDRMRRLLALVGDPHLGLKAVHIAGTKGKGSTAAMMAAVLQAAGLRTGLYTSPHLERIEERIVLDGRMCGTADFVARTAELQSAVERLERLEPAVAGTGPTFFEITTAMAFLQFAIAGVEVAVLEVGLGGRLDSTNVCRPEVCVITSISFDHMKQLGNTLAAIAGEKAGIIKANVPVVSGVVEAEPRDVIAARARLCGAALVQRGVDYDFSAGGKWAGESAGEVFDYWEPGVRPTWELRGVRPGMLGEHQAANAAAAIAATNQLRRRGWKIDDDALRQGIAAARCPARIELVARRPAVIVDVAHNPASIQALIRALERGFCSQQRILVFASSKDKDYEAMLRLALPAFDVIILTRYVNNPRAMEPEGLLAFCQAERATESAPAGAERILHATARPGDAWRLARLVAGPEDLIAIAGSFFLAAELRQEAIETKVDRPQSALS